MENLTEERFYNQKLIEKTMVHCEASCCVLKRCQILAGDYSDCHLIACDMISGRLKDCIFDKVSRVFNPEASINTLYA